MKVNPTPFFPQCAEFSMFIHFKQLGCIYLSICLPFPFPPKKSSMQMLNFDFCCFRLVYEH